MFFHIQKIHKQYILFLLATEYEMWWIMNKWASLFRNEFQIQLWKKSFPNYSIIVWKKNLRTIWLHIFLNYIQTENLYLTNENINRAFSPAIILCLKYIVNIVIELDLRFVLHSNAKNMHISKLTVYRPLMIHQCWIQQASGKMEKYFFLFCFKHSISLSYLVLSKC